MSAARSYAPRTVDDDRSALPPDPFDDPAYGTIRRWPRRPEAAAGEAGREADSEPAAGTGEAAAAVDRPEGIDLSGLSVAGITRRRVGWLAAALVSAWIVVVFARQAGEAASASSRADQIAAENQALAAEVAALEHELDIIERPEYVAQQARQYRLGTPREIAFTLDPSAPAPGPDAPGSAATGLGAEAARQAPLDSWLSLLFGPSDRD